MAKGDSEYVDLTVSFITDNIHIVGIEFISSISWTFNYVISLSEGFQAR